MSVLACIFERDQGRIRTSRAANLDRAHFDGNRMPRKLVMIESMSFTTSCRTTELLPSTPERATDETEP